MNAWQVAGKIVYRDSEVYRETVSAPMILEVSSPFWDFFQKAADRDDV